LTGKDFLFFTAGIQRESRSSGECEEFHFPSVWIQTLHGSSWWGVAAERDVSHKRGAIAEFVMD